MFASLCENKGITELTKACLNISMSVLKYLLCEVNHVDVNITDRFDNSALHLGVWCSKDNYYIHNYMRPVREVM